MNFQLLWNRPLLAGNTAAHMIGFVLALLLTAVVAWFVGRAFRNTLHRVVKRTETRLDDLMIGTFARPIFWIVLVSGMDLSFELLVLPARVLEIIGNVTTMVVTLLIAWSATNFVGALRGAYLAPAASATRSRADDQIIGIFERIAKVLIWGLAVLLVISNMGYDAMSVLAGLGLGGLAIAMAAKDTLSNVFGSVTLIADKPFEIGDVVTLAGHTGTVEEVNLRTFRLRTFENTRVTVPNATLVGGVVENLSARKARRFLGTLNLEYSITSAELEAAMEAIREILRGQPQVQPDFSVRFSKFGSSGLEVDLLYWVDPPEAWAEVVGSVNMAVMRRFEAEDWPLAQPGGSGRRRRPAA